MSYELQAVTRENEPDFYAMMRENMTGIGALYEDFHEGYQSAVAVGRAFVLMQGDALIGAATIEDRGQGHSYLSDVYIAQAHRHQGHGRALVSACEGMAAEFGQCSMGLICEDDLRGFYRRLGYEDSGPHGENFGMVKNLRP